MYSIAFFMGNHEQIFERLSSCLSKDLTDVSIFDGQQEKQFNCLDDIPPHSGYWYPHTWHIHGQSLHLPAQRKLVEIPTYAPPQFTTSFEQIDTTLNQLATDYLWTIFPWGGAKRFSAFGFLSGDRNLCDQFIDGFSVAQKDYLVSRYDVPDKLSQCIQAILIGGYYYPAYRLWNICDCDSYLPLLITDLHFDEDTFSAFGWNLPQYELIRTISSVDNQVLQIYQVLNQASFESICKLSTQEPETLIWVHSNTELQALENLLRETEADNSSSDLKHLERILETTEWFYGIDRDRADYGDSLFVSRDNLLLNKFNQINLKDDYRLISCF